MRVLLCHVHYRQAGGEDAVFETEAGVLRHAGHDVATLEPLSADLNRIGFIDRVEMALRYQGHDYGRRLMRRAIEEHRPDIVHFHNLYPQLGPGAIEEAHRLGCATVQTIHNYRLSCLAGTHLRNEQTCRLCRPGHFLPGLLHGCYRGSRLQTVVAQRATVQQWHTFIDRHTPTLWLSLTGYMRDHWIEFGAPGERIVIKPNSVGEGRPANDVREGVFCGGRLSPEKGFLQLVEAWPPENPDLIVAGTGPLEAQIAAAAETRPNVRFMGRLEHPDMLKAMRSARAVAMPSVWPEPLPLVALEAFAQGTPVVAFADTSLGSVVARVSPDLVVPFPQFDRLVKLAASLASDTDLWRDLSVRSIEVWRERYSHTVNEKALQAAYEKAIEVRAAHL